MHITKSSKVKIKDIISLLSSPKTCVKQWVAMVMGNETAIIEDKASKNNAIWSNLPTFISATLKIPISLIATLRVNAT